MWNAKKSQAFAILAVVIFGIIIVATIIPAVMTTILQIIAAFKGG